MRKKLIIFLLALIASMTESFAQSSLVATLSHGKNLTPYYGTDAFKEAYAAAVDGDCITLSSGTFEGTSISKGITVRGAGMDTDDETQTIATTLKMGNTTNIATSDECEVPVIFEGLYVDTYSGTYKTTFKGAGKGLSFIKCRLNGFELNGGIMYFIHCRVSGDITAKQPTPNDAYYLSNSIVYSFNSQFHSGLHFTNCIIYNSTKASSEMPEVRNCIILRGPAPYNTFNSVALTGLSSSDPSNYDGNFGHISNTTNSVSTAAEVFANYTSGVNFTSDSKQYILTDVAKKTYLGNDGTQAGIYGGANPFTATPTNPRITKLVVSTNSDGGKLKVKLNVK